MGGMSVADVAPESALFINPSLLGEIQGLKTTFSQDRFSADEFDFRFAASLPLVKERLGVGLGWDNQLTLNQAQTGIVRDSNGQVVIDPATGQPQTQVLGFFTQSQNTFYGSVGIKGSFYTLGASAKYFLYDFGNQEGQGWGFDAACRIRLAPTILLGATLFDLGNSRIYFKGGAPDQTLPRLWVASLSWNFWRNDDFSLSAEPGASGGIWGSAPSRWGGGMELSWRGSAFIRAGYDGNQLSGGVGLVAHPTKIFSEIRVDYAYLTQAPDNYPSRLTLTVAW